MQNNTEAEYSSQITRGQKNAYKRIVQIFVLMTEHILSETLNPLGNDPN